MDGIAFHSKREAHRWIELSLLAKTAQIRHLRRQVPYPLHVQAVRLGQYLADFVYEQPSGAAWVERVEDVKGMDTPLGKWKRKHLLAEYGIDVVIVR